MSGWINKEDRDAYLLELSAAYLQCADAIWALDLTKVSTDSDVTGSKRAHIQRIHTGLLCTSHSLLSKTEEPFDAPSPSKDPFHNASVEYLLNWLTRASDDPTDKKVLAELSRRFRKMTDLLNASLA